MAVPRVRAVVAKTPLLRLLETHNDRRWAHYLRSLFAVGDCDDLIGMGTSRLRYACMERLEALLEGRQAEVFEYGSGASTVWLAKRVRRLVSVEHDPRFHNMLAKRLAGQGHVSLLLCPPQPAAPLANHYPSGRAGMEGQSFEQYVKAIDRNNDRYDIIIIDGRCRCACLQHALAHLKPEGVIVFDDAQRKRYRQSLSGLAGFATHMVSGWAPATAGSGKTAFISRRMPI